MNEKSVSVKLPIDSGFSYLAIVSKRAEYEKYLIRNGVEYTFYNGSDDKISGEYDGCIIMPEEDALAFKLKFGI